MSAPDRIWAWPRLEWKADSGTWSDCELPRSTEYIRRETTVLAALPEVQAMIADAETRALDAIGFLSLIADIRAATVGSKPMLFDLAQALVAWRDDAVAKEREACAELAASSTVPAQTAMRLAAAIRKRGEGQP